MLKLIVLLSLMFNTWALKDRALFAINDEVYFLSEVQRFLKASNHLACYFNDKTLLRAVLPKKENSLEKLNDDAAQRSAMIIKLRVLSSTMLSVPINSSRLHKCFDHYLKEGKILVRIEHYLRSKVVTGAKSASDINKTLQVLKSSISSEMSYRAYY